MRIRHIIFGSIFSIALSALLSAATPSYNAPPAQTGSTPFAAHDDFGIHRPAPEASATPQVKIQQQPFHLGESIFNGTYASKKSAKTHVAEKAHRFGILRSGLASADQQKINPAELASRLNDREANDLEYYIKTKYGKFVNVPPSWAKTTPPIKD